MESRLTELEIKLSFAEDQLDALNRTVFQQQEQIDLLRRQLVRLADQMQELTRTERGAPDEEIPPHY